jgi:Tfp pilus assembly protein PilW
VAVTVARRGATLVELLVGTALGLAVLAALAAAFGAGGRLLLGSAARAEGEDVAQLAVEAFVFDVRRAGYDPASPR